MITDSIHTLHRAIWSYIERWKNDPTGLWWEADLSLDIGRALVDTFSHQEKVKVANPPSFLGAWPSVHFRRLGTNNYFRSTRKAADRLEKEQEVPQKPLGGWLYPDYYYRKPETDDCEWIVELKLWSVNGNALEKAQVDGAITGFKADAKKWSGQETYPFIFLAVNIPGHFQRAPRSRHTYLPNDFTRGLINEVRNSVEF